MRYCKMHKVQKVQKVQDGVAAEKVGRVIDFR
jgi:hypothetical protein